MSFSGVLIACATHTPEYRKQEDGLGNTDARLAEAILLLRAGDCFQRIAGATRQQRTMELVCRRGFDVVRWWKVLGLVGGFRKLLVCHERKWRPWLVDLRVVDMLVGEQLPRIC